MGIWSILETWAIWRDPEAGVRADADALIEIWGDTAYDVAANLSWREDAGLLRSSSPGHWGRVHEEIGHRLSPQRHTPPASVSITGREPDTGAPISFHCSAARSSAVMSSRGA